MVRGSVFMRHYSLAWLVLVLRRKSAEGSGAKRCIRGVSVRLGNDSQLAVSALRDALGDVPEKEKIVDLVGGLKRWSVDVDPGFPVY